MKNRWGMILSAAMLLALLLLLPACASAATMEKVLVSGEAVMIVDPDIASHGTITCSLSVASDDARYDIVCATGTAANPGAFAAMNYTKAMTAASGKAPGPTTALIRQSSGANTGMLAWICVRSGSVTVRVKTDAPEPHLKLIRIDRPSYDTIGTPLELTFAQKGHDVRFTMSGGNLQKLPIVFFGTTGTRVRFARSTEDEEAGNYVAYEFISSQVKKRVYVNGRKQEEESFPYISSTTLSSYSFRGACLELDIDPVTNETGVFKTVSGYAGYAVPKGWLGEPNEYITWTDEDIVAWDSTRSADDDPVGESLMGFGTHDDPYVIASAAHWNILAAGVEQGFATEGKKFRMTEDISVTTTMGTWDNPFAGTFDGDGNTLTFNARNTDGSKSVAPFAWTDAAEIRQLNVEGAITGSTGRAAGLIGENGNTSLVLDVRVGMSISGTFLIGGFCVGEGPGGVSFIGCAFNGTISATMESGGFVAWSEQNSHLYFKDCVFAPVSASLPGQCGTFFYDSYHSGTQSLDNSYYLAEAGVAQGRKGLFVTGGDGVTVDFDSETEIYTTCSILIYPAGMRYSFMRFAGPGDILTPVLTYTGQENLIGFAASSGTLTREDGVWTLTMGEEDVSIRAVFGSVFDIPDFTLPDSLLAVEAEAFEGAQMHIAVIPARCAAIGDRAFRGCSNLLQIRIPADCALGSDVFDGCGTVYVFSAAGSPAEAYCSAHDNCVFVEDAQN